MAIDEDTKKEFDKLLAQWKEHIREKSIYSFDEPYLECEAYQRIIALGPKILPFIREDYATPWRIGQPDRLWCYVIYALVPDFEISVGEEGSGGPIEKRAGGAVIAMDVDKIKEFTLKWLDGNMKKYSDTAS